MTTDYSAHVALDWGDKTHAFALQTAQGTSESGTIDASPEALHGWLEQLHARTGGGLVALALESGKNGLLHALLGYPWLHLYPVHPAASARFRTAFVPSGAKDDVPDAQILLTLLLRHRDQLRRLEPEDPATRRLAALVEARRHLVDQCTRFAQELMSALKLYFPSGTGTYGRRSHRSARPGFPGSLAGPGQRTSGPAGHAPRLLVAFGANRSRYPEASNMQKLAGIAPVREKSGRQLWVHWRWNAPKFLRQTFVEWAASTVVHSAWAKAYYHQQRRAGKRRQAVLRALAFKWIRIVWRCWQTRTPYDEARYIDALSRRQSPLAIELAQT